MTALVASLSVGKPSWGRSRALPSQAKMAPKSTAQIR